MRKLVLIFLFLPFLGISQNGNCEWETEAEMNAFTPTQRWHCKRAYVSGTDTHFIWIGGVWAEQTIGATADESLSVTDQLVDGESRNIELSNDATLVIGDATTDYLNIDEASGNMTIDIATDFERTIAFNNRIAINDADEADLDSLFGKTTNGVVRVQSVMDAYRDVFRNTFSDEFTYAIVVKGQSNGDGAAVLTTFTPEEQALNESVFVMQKDRTTDYLQPLDPSIGNHRNTGANFAGSILPLGVEYKYLLENKGPVYILNNSFSGNPISEFIPGGGQYLIRKNREEVFLEYLRKIGKPIKLYILWYQGENDATTAAQAAAYETNFDILSQVHEEIYGIQPITVIREINPVTYPFGADINTALNNIANNYDNCYILPNIGYDYAVDDIHLTADGYRQLADAQVDTLIKNGVIEGTLIPEVGRPLDLSRYSDGDTIRVQEIEPYTGTVIAADDGGERWIKWQDLTFYKGRDVLGANTPIPTLRISDSNYADSLQMVSFRFKYKNAVTSEFRLEVSINATNSLYFDEVDGYTLRFEDGNIRILANRGGISVLGAIVKTHVVDTEYLYRMRVEENNIILDESVDDGDTWSNVLSQLVPTIISTRPERIESGGVYFNSFQTGYQDIYLRDIKIWTN